MIKLIRYDGEFNPNQEALKGRYGQRGEKFGSFVAVKNMLFVILYKGATVTDYELPAVYDGFLQCSDGSVVLIENNKLTCNLGEGVTAQGILKLQGDN